MKINLYFDYYKSKNEERQNELDFCKDENLTCPFFDIIHIEREKRSTYNDFFEWCQKHSGAINILCNSDITFDRTILLTQSMFKNDCYALSRYDNGTLYNHCDSQDVWIFKGAPKGIDAPFFMGIPGCDNAIAYKIKQAGYNITNPCHSIHTHHNHNSNFRTYPQNSLGNPKRVFIPDPYLTLTPCSL